MVGSNPTIAEIRLDILGSDTEILLNADCSILVSTGINVRYINSDNIPPITLPTSPKSAIFSPHIDYWLYKHVRS